MHMKKWYVAVILMLAAFFARAQSNITISNPEAQQVLFGNYDPSAYTPPVIISISDSILQGIVNGVSTDTLQKWLKKIDSYHNRNTGSDTVSESRGIGAVRRWIHGKFNEVRAASGNRLLVSWMDFDLNVCGMGHHRNVLAVLPGLDTTKKEMLIVEGHFDTRCQGGCDTACYSPGMEDNGSGTVLVMELARVMSRYAFDHTILFACVTGEDQGLYGAKALSKWIKDNDLPVKAVFNNDVIGGIICGMTSSPPSCPYFNHMDSTHVRIFSYSPYNDSSLASPHKQLARYIKLHQVERINPLLSTPMEVNIILGEDRTGRSGDHIPFRQKGYTAIRFCSQNEHGNGSGTPPDRQHTSGDVLGLDLSLPPDGVIDTFFVDMNYLRRNTIMNGVNLGFLALSPPMPQPVFTPVDGGMQITMTGPDSLYMDYRVGVRSDNSGTLYFDTVYHFTGAAQMEVNGLDPGGEYYFSVANVADDFESLFCEEYTVFPVGIRSQIRKDWGVELRQNVPNPFTDVTVIPVEVSENRRYPNASVIISDLAGRVVATIPADLQPGMNRIGYRNSGALKGMHTYSLYIEGKKVATEKMVIF
jgi:hypothetical protein